MSRHGRCDSPSVPDGKTHSDSYRLEQLRFKLCQMDVSMSSHVQPLNKPKPAYRRKLNRMLRKGQISQEVYDKHMLGLAYYKPPPMYHLFGVEGIERAAAQPG